MRVDGRERMIDANRNRLLEGLRVAEDVARFWLEEAALSHETKALRHACAATIARWLPPERLAEARDVRRDPGRGRPLGDEMRRAGPSELLSRNLRRASESLRVLEEAAKSDGGPAREIEGLRYRLYELEREALLSAARPKLDLSLYVVTGSHICGLPRLPAVVRQAVEGGATAVQLREKHLPDSKLLPLGRKVRAIAKAGGALFVVDDRPDLARLLDADGVHVGQEDLSVAEARRIAGPAKIVGKSTHSLAQAVAAEREGADYIGIGPIFPTPTKDYGPIGTDVIRRVRRRVRIPFVCIGGIDPSNVARVVAAGAPGIAVVTAVMGAKNPRLAARALRRAVARGGKR
jgi:thiamine-phosphate pyrophosphorylase